MKLFNKSGVTLMSLVVVIIVIIILTLVAFVSYNSVVGHSLFARITSEIKEVEQKVALIRAQQGQTDGKVAFEDEINKGFRKLYLNNAPPEFTSFDKADTTGYWVDMDRVGEGRYTIGRQDVPAITATFGEDDILVYDKDGKVFYLKGYMDDQEVLYHRVDSKVCFPILMKPIILDVSYELKDENKYAQITIKTDPYYAQDLEVRVGDAYARKTGSNTYVVNVYSNKVHYVLVKEKDYYYNSVGIEVSGIITDEDTTPPIIDSMDLSVSEGKTYVNVVAHDDETRIRGYSFSVDPNLPTDWESYFNNSLIMSFEITENGTYYFWVKNEVDLTAHDEINAEVLYEYTIMFNANGGEGGPISQSKISNKDILLDSGVPTRENYEFKGWADTADATVAMYQPGQLYSVNADITLYAVWERLVYTITFDSNGGTTASFTQEKNYQEDLVIPNTTPDRYGYEFLGWSENSSATIPDYQKGGRFTKDENTTLYAVWKVLVFSVKFNANGGEGAPATQAKYGNQDLLLSTTKPTKLGYNFLGWAESASATVYTYGAGSTYTENKDIELFAVWQLITYSITYNANSGSNAPEAGTKNYGAPYTISEIIPTREGYHFKGWSTSNTGSTIQYSAGQDYTQNADLKLYAVWERIFYTITYNANGGSGAPSGQTKEYDGRVTLSTAIPSRDMYNFKGWGTSSSTNIATYQPGDDYTHNESIELFAVWQEKLQITYNSNTGAFSDNTLENIVVYDETIGVVNQTKYSHTSNISDAGVRNGDYSSSLATKDVVSISGASSLHVKVTYGTENSWDMLYIFDKVYTGGVTRNMSAGQKYTLMGGNNSLRTVEYDIPGDTLTFAFYSDSSVQYYGYYAEISVSEEGTIMTPSAGEYKEPDHESLKFVGWSLSPSATTATYQNEGQVTNNVPNKSIVYAVWKVPEVNLLLGSSFNVAIRSLAGETSPNNSSNYNESIKEIVWTDTKPSQEILENASIVSTPDSESPAYAWFDDGTIYLYTKAEKVYTNQNCQSMFYNLRGVESIDLSKIDTSKSTNFYAMFDQCVNLKTIDLSNFNTSNVTNLSHMFFRCQNLETVDLSSFDTSNVTNVSYMFSQGGLNVSSRKDEYPKLREIIVSDKFVTNKVTNFDSMFAGLDNLQSLDFVKNFDTSRATSFSWFFAGCKSAKDLDVSGFDTKNVTNMNDMFACCLEVEELDVSNFDTSNVTDMGGMFEYCRSLDQIDVSNFDTSKVTNMSYMFSRVEVSNLDLRSLDTSSVKNMSDMFSYSKIVSVDVSSFDTSNVKNMNAMFYGCNKLASIDVSNFDTSNCTDIGGMFCNCSSLESLDLTNFDTSKVTKFIISHSYWGFHYNNIEVDINVGVFTGCSKLKTLDITGWDISNADFVGPLFMGCSRLEKVYVSNGFTIKDQTNYMFYNCSSILGAAGTRYDYGHVHSEYAHIDGGTSNPGYLSVK